MSNTEMIDYIGTTLWYNAGITRKFSDIYPSYEDFLTDYNKYDFNPKEIWLGTETYEEDGVTKTRPNNLRNTYYLLLSKHAEDPISGDESRFRVNLWATVWTYGGVWQKKLDIQNKLRNLSEEDLLKGSQAIYNAARNPNMSPNTDSFTPLNFINAQNTTNYKRSKLDGYEALWNLLRVDINTDYLNKFNKLFSPLATQFANQYITRED